MNEQQAEHVESVPDSSQPDMTGAWIVIGWQKHWATKGVWVLNSEACVTRVARDEAVKDFRKDGHIDIRVLRVPPVRSEP